MKIAFIGTYPPRECGIGTFTKNLFNSVILKDKPGKRKLQGFVVALNDFNTKYDYPAEVKTIINQEKLEDYIEAAKNINLSGADVCILEHEFGIFGGQDGVNILPLLHRLEIPYIVTLHTILNKPSYNQKAVLQQICKMAQKIVVMSKKAIDFLINIYDVPKDKIALIEHGVPDLQYNSEQTKKEFKLHNKKVLFTFGFVGRNKGIETIIKALPKVVKKHPEVVYIIQGKTHPNVLRYSGEEYRIYLMRLVKNLGLEKHVVFLNEFVEVQDLFKYLFATDIYITPYLNEAQITSGTLSYAVGVGAAAVSTPYWHAEELLAEGRGILFNFNDDVALSSILIELLDTPRLLASLKNNAFKYGRKITWPSAGKKYASLAETVAEKGMPEDIKKDTIFYLFIIPPFSLTHINRLTDDTGIIQHAKFGIPNLKEGYCLDDNARALLMVLMAYNQFKDERALELSPVYLSYIHYMQNSDGTFKNFLSFDRQYLDKIGSEDSFGRTIWALGYLLGFAPNDAYYQTGKEVFFKATPNFSKLKSIRSIANTMIGVCHYLKAHPNDDAMVEQLRNMAQCLVSHFKENKSADWHWFEPLLAYDNGMLPLAMLHAAEILNDNEVTEIALASMNFLTHHTLKNDYLSVIGNEKWFKKDGERSLFAQQPVDAMASVLMYNQAYRLTEDSEHLQKMYFSFLWFLGENDLRMNLYDFETHGCCDGFEQNGVNRNQGAESSLAYLIAHLTVLQAYGEFVKSDKTISEPKSKINNKKLANKKVTNIISA